MESRVTGPSDRVDTARQRAEVAARRKARRKIDPRWGIAALVAIALPALAATTNFSLHWGDVARIPAGGNGPVVARMPFERAGWNFPGSAYYYLEADSVLAPVAGSETPSDAPSAIATAFRRAGSVQDQQRALICLAQAIYYEAASESDSGQQAVAQVVLNRVKHSAWPSTVCGVVYQGSSRRTGCQFSFTCDGSLARKPSRPGWNKALRIARAALGGYVHAPAGLATHYHTLAVNPYWAPKLVPLTVIGAHRFYVLPGTAGTGGAFAARYRGDEPTVAAVRARDPETVDPLDSLPVASSPAGTAAAGTADGPATAATPRSNDRLPPAPKPLEPETPDASPSPKTDRLPGGGNVRPEYRDSGKWRDRKKDD